MLGHRELAVQDYTEMLKRRGWLILACAVLCLAIGWGASYTLTPRYVSQTLVLIEQQKVPEDYVKPVVNEDLNSRLASMREQILSRSRIQPIIERYNLYADGKTSMDDRVDKTRKDIGIKPISSAQSSGMPGFFISFEARDAHTAQQVCGDITSLFVSANLSAREESAEGTTDFLKQQLNEAKTSLDEQDAKLAAFEQKNIGKLSGQTVHLGEGSLTMGNPSESALQALTARLDATTQTVSHLQQSIAMQEAMIAQMPHESTHGNAAAGVSEEGLKTQLKDALTQEKELESVYTPSHPDVIAIKRRVASLREEMAHAPAAEPAKKDSAVSASDSPQLRQLKLQLRSDQQSLAAAKQEQARIEQQVRGYEAKIEASPLVEEEYKQITRDHDTALQFYNTLLAKMNESSMATALEHRQQGEQFRVMDAPNLPDSPTFPNHLKFAGGGLAAGLILGLFLAALLEYRDTSVRSERDIWAFTSLPTLAVLSYVGGLAQRSAVRKRWRFFTRKPGPAGSARE
jgi:polysaccharide chain length determinant protein (PEP-CTERM system associated)